MRGRPKKAEAELEAQKTLIRQQLADLLMRVDSQDVTATQLIQMSGVSRPTFYKWFPGGLEQVLDELLDDQYASLERGVSAALRSSDGPEVLGDAIIAAYFAWLHELGDFADCLSRETHRAGSAMARRRQRMLSQLRRALMQVSPALRQQDMILDALMRVVLSVAHEPAGDQSISLQAREAAARAIVLPCLRQFTNPDFTVLAG